MKETLSWNATMSWEGEVSKTISSMSIIHGVSQGKTILFKYSSQSLGSPLSSWINGIVVSNTHQWVLINSMMKQGKDKM